jgi:hypothetical protein
MSAEDYIEAKPRPAPAVERLKDFVRELSERAGRPVDVTLRLDAGAWRALRVDFQRPGQPKPERYFAIAGTWGMCRFEKVEATPDAAGTVA